MTLLSTTKWMYEKLYGYARCLGFTSLFHCPGDCCQCEMGCTSNESVMTSDMKRSVASADVVTTDLNPLKRARGITESRRLGASCNNGFESVERKPKL